MLGQETLEGLSAASMGNTEGFYPVARNHRKGSGSSKLCLVAVTRIERVTRGL